MQMITAIRIYARRGRHWLKKAALHPGAHVLGSLARPLLRGFCLSAGALAHRPMPLALAQVCATQGREAILTALGGCLGYWLFWGEQGWAGMLWLAAGLTMTLILGSRPSLRANPWLLSAGAGLIPGAAGVLLRLRLGDTTPMGVYTIRVALAMGATWLILSARQNPRPEKQWLLRSMWVLALAQIAPTPWLCLGIAAGAALGGGAFPQVALGGLALDLAQVTPVPMTGVLCAAWLLGQLPGPTRRLQRFLPGLCGLLFMALGDLWAPEILPPLVLGGLLSRPGDESAGLLPRRGGLGSVQVRLELAAGVLGQMQQLLLEAQPEPVDEAALLARAGERACGGCALRKNCSARAGIGALPTRLLHLPLSDDAPLPPDCRKHSRLLPQLRQAQEELRALVSARALRREARSALIQQYQFLTAYLQDLSDSLDRRSGIPRLRYQPQITCAANRNPEESGDRFQCFRGTGSHHYILLCDGMGTGLGAMEEGAEAAQMLRNLLTAGFPAEYALRSLNSLCALRGMAGAVTVDLAQLDLDTGKALLYKWGAAASYLFTAAGAEKIGTAGPPPGLSVTERREQVERLSLRRGELLLVCSDGIAGEAAMRCWGGDFREPPGELAARILEAGAGTDDATLALIRLRPVP